MASQTDREQLKRQALINLESARHGLRSGVAEVKEELSPSRILKDNIRKYPLSSVVLGVGVGVLVMKVLLPSKSISHEIKRDKSEEVAKKRTLTAVLLSGIWAMTRGPLLGFASQQLAPILTQQLTRFQPPTKPETFE